MDQGATQWHKSSYSGDYETCVEQGVFPAGGVAVRDTKNHGTGPVLAFSPDQWGKFLNEVSRDTSS